MDNYYVNNKAQPTGEHEVHKEGCSCLPSDKTYLGIYSNCQDAVKEAKKHYSNVDGCAFCTPDCHTK